MKKLILSFMTAALCIGMQAEVRLPAVIGSNMVLQQNSEVNLWGWAQAGATVTVCPSWTKQKFKVKVNDEGRWQTTVPTVAAGGPYTLTFSDGSKQKTVLENILMGEVWVCSGQSNMEMPVAGYGNQPVEGSVEAIISAADYPDIRLFTVPHKYTSEPQDDCESSWKLSSPQSVRAFSAAGYFFGRELNRRLKVPVGIIASDYGGTFIECWMSREALNATKRLHPEVEQGFKGFQASCGLYNGMICPIKGFTAKGFIWYQGEANRGNWYDYTELQKELIRLWRKDWGNNEMPFYITQIAPYVYNGDNCRLSALFIDQQYKAADQTPHCEVASTQDIGERNLIHPAKKQDIAHRLAWLALACDYGIQGLPVHMPRFKNFEEKDGHLTLHFDFSIASCKDNPEPRDCFLPINPVKGFEVAGEDHKFYPATGQHQWGKNTIEVWSDAVPHPVAVRYAYRNWDGEANVKTQLGQPLPSFRSDDWEIDDL